MILYYKNKARGDMFEEKGISEQFVKIKNLTRKTIESTTINQSKSCWNY